MTARKKVSQQRIARDLKVSQALVSLALNGRKDGIHAETYQRIWTHALSLGYEPKGMNLERSPTPARSQQIGFILRAGLSIHTQGSYFSHVLHGLHTELAEQGYAAVFLGTEDTLTAERLAHFFRPRHAPAGVVLFGEVSAAFLQALRAQTGNVVAVSARHPGFCHSVVGNEPQALQLLVQHLWELGHRRIGWLGGNVGLGRHEARHAAFVSALEACGGREDERYRVYLKQADRAEGAQAIEELLPLAKRKDFPTAFITYNTLMAAGAAMAWLREGGKIPGECSIAAADNSRLAQVEKPRLTVAGTDPEKLGQAAARLLLDVIGRDDESLHDLILPSEFVAGESTGTAKR
ncbi:LacI family transcriptional regulator [Horticoccus luteus]|uniref:LacI family transcriptional regulator n=1 Tax=Horticoccus luteus TaxID=2862869 RepID=A0A8F9XGB1_9BACT|nr:LacI family DNA-binding transcriptional regulator [Horticoccus luteus]QYM78982.1 LacI family transcriptional regulator [Horticoccus luteus]